MAAKKTRRAVKRAKSAAKSATTIGGGPLTLAEAHALARLQRPARAPKRGLMATATPANLAVERRKLRLQQRRVIRERTADYTAVMRILKKQGVARAAGNARRRAPKARTPKAAPSVVTAPLQVFAEGDSWFDYPVPLFGGGIIPRLENLLGVPILNLAKAGDEVRFMLGVEQRQLLSQQFSNGCPAGGSWDVALFSGGGNDIVDNPMSLWIKDFDATLPAARHIHDARFDAALALVRAGYEDLIAMRDTLSPTTHLVFHAYDFAIPDGRGICGMGPWLKPAFDVHGFTDHAKASEVVKIMLQRFAAVLQALADTQNNVTCINAQGTLPAVLSAWHNELHPAKAGFNLFADRFRQKLKQLFPAKVP